jgi:hypothetical protein
LDCHLGFDASAGGKAPHLLASLTFEEKCRLTSSGGLASACRALLNAKAHDVTNMVSVMHKSGQFDQELASITQPMSPEAFLKLHDYVFVGLGQNRTFFNWRSPYSVQCNPTIGSAQIDFHLFCQDYGLDLHRWRWDACASRALFLGGAASQEDVLTGFIRNSPKANGASILELLYNLSKEGLRQDDRNLGQYLKAAQDCATTFSSMFKPYVNVAYAPAAGGPTSADALDLAVQDYHKIRTLRHPALTASEPHMGLPTQREFRQFFLTPPDLLAELNAVGAVTLIVEGCNVWCRPMSSSPFPDQDQLLVAVVVRNHPELLDKAIRDYLPEAASRIDAERENQHVVARSHTTPTHPMLAPARLDATWTPANPH